MTSPEIAIQDKYIDRYAHCYGCGRHNEHGLHLKSHIMGDELVCSWLPQDHHISLPGFLNGGVIATLIDCHCIGMAVAWAAKEEGIELNENLAIFYVTASIKVDYIKPTPLDGKPVTLRAKIKSIEGRKTWLTCSFFSNEIETAKGEVLAVKMNEIWQAGD